MPAPSTVRVTVAVTTAMTMATLVPFGLGALGPSISRDLDLSRSELGGLSSVVSAVAALGAFGAGRVVGRLGGRTAIVGLLVLAAVGLAVSSFGSMTFLVIGSLIAGLSQAIANPATNAVISTGVPSQHVGWVTGIKQSGVQLSPFFAGAVLVPIAALSSWQWALRVAAVLAAITIISTAWIARGDRPPPSIGRRRINLPLRTLAAYSLCIGLGTAAVTVHLANYAADDLGIPYETAGAILVVTGIAGIGGRIFFGRRAQAGVPAWTTFAGLAFAAACAVVAIACAQPLGVGLLVVGALGFGLSAVSANAVSMVAVVQPDDQRTTARASAWVSTGFYTGTTLGALLAGVIADAASYTWSWIAVIAVYLVAVAIALVARALSLRPVVIDEPIGAD